MGIIKNRHGVYLARKKVPDDLCETVAALLGNGKDRVPWLQRSLRTKDLREANTLAKPVLMEFDRLLAKARQEVKPRPLREHLSDAEIDRMAAYHFASLLAEDESVRRDGLDIEPHTGLTEREFRKVDEALEGSEPAMRAALARGNISWVEDEIEEVCAVFSVRLQKNSEPYRRLGMALLRVGVEVLEKQQLRQNGYPVATPKAYEPSDPSASSTSESLTAAFEGWRKATDPRAGTAAEFAHAVQRFKELHGEVAVGAITRRHVATFREALQYMPKRRAGGIRELPLPELVEWAKKHPDAPRIRAGTVNKLLGGVGAVVEWAGRNGYVDNDRPWVNPFTRMRLEREQPDREHWSVEDLRTLFSSPIFTQGQRPRGGAGEAAFWLPLLALFTGARLGELAALTASDLLTDPETGIHYLRITEDRALQSTVKTRGSRRVVPVHPELLRLGLLRLIAERQDSDGTEALLFPQLKPSDGSRWGSAWSKWFGSHIRKLGIPPPTVFHSMRHGFKDALRRAGV